MIDDDIHALCAREPDRALEQFEADVWVGVARREQSIRLMRRVVAVQAIVLAASLIGSLLAGWYSGGSTRAGDLDVFSPRMNLTASARLIGNGP